MIHGHAIDISTSGLKIAVPIAHPMGSEVEVYLPARREIPFDRAITVAGRIIWVLSEADTTFTMGIRLYQPAMPKEVDSSHPNPKLPKPNQPAPTDQPAAEGNACSVQTHTNDDKVNVRRCLIPLGLLFVVLAAFLSLKNANLGGNVNARAGPQEKVQADVHRTINENEQVELGNAQQAAIDGELKRAIESFTRLSRVGTTPTIRLIAKLGHADALRAQGQIPEAVSALGMDSEEAPGIPQAWRTLTKDFRDDLLKFGPNAKGKPLLINAMDLLRPEQLAAARHGQKADPAPPLDANQTIPAQTAGDVDPKSPSRSAALPIAPIPEPATESPPAAAPTRIEIDQSDFVLTLFQGDQRIAEYPVGVGASNTPTPLGTFVIANKLLDPIWYNKGNPVKPGDPRNPLGRHWMGLGDKSGPLTYGIHEATDPKSIGTNFGLGCIRMRPSDAAELFRACDVGTPVRIIP